MEVFIDRFLLDPSSLSLSGGRLQRIAVAFCQLCFYNKDWIGLDVFEGEGAHAAREPRVWDSSIKILRFYGHLYEQI